MLSIQNTFIYYQPYHMTHTPNNRRGPGRGVTQQNVLEPQSSVNNEDNVNILKEEIKD